MNIENLIQISETEWEIPTSIRADMRVPVRLFATREMLEQIIGDKSLEQAVNATTLPGVIGHVLVMPDMHQGYGFPIGGVAATKYPHGVISPGAIGYDINCLSGDTRILHAHGYTRTIQEMAEHWQTATLLCLNTETKQIDAAQPIRWFGQKPKSTVLRITTKNGFSLTATSDHPLWTPQGMVRAGLLQAGDQVAMSLFQGVQYEQPNNKPLVTEASFSEYLDSLRKSQRGNALVQICNALTKRNLLPLNYASDAIPYLCKIIGFLFGDGTLRFDTRTNKGYVAFFGQPEDLEEIRRDIVQLGFKPSRVWSRERTYRIRTMYDEYTFARTEHWVTVNSTAFAALLSYLGVPIGKKTKQEYCIPSWLMKTPLWQKRLFLAALFGAEMSTPQTVTGHDCNMAAPTLSMNKSEEFENNGRVFLEQVAVLLKEFGVKTVPISAHREQINADNRQSIRLRLIVSAEPGNLIQLWSKIGFEYNHKRKLQASIATHYVITKQNLVAARQAVAEQAAQLKAMGMSKSYIIERLGGEIANERFIERSIYGGRSSLPRINQGFETFSKFSEIVTGELGQSGLVWDTIVAIEPIHYNGLVYDFTMDHPDHNFIAGGFVVANCGVRLLASSLDFESARGDIDTLATLLNRYCPSGVGKEGTIKVNLKELDHILRDGSRWALKNGYASEADLARTEESGSVEGADPGGVSERARTRGREQVGSLGAGNHFIEVDVVDQIFNEEAANAMGLYQGCLTVQIHCGSRGLGHQVCTDYVREFQNAVRKYGIDLPDRELVCAPMDSPEGQAYLGAMRAAANFAFANRQLLAHSARRAFEETFASRTGNRHLHQVYDIAHNMGKIETHEIDGRQVKVCVHRKGATRAFGPGAPGLPPEYRKIGQPVIIPGSMGTASWVLVGTAESMTRSFGSSCHGAGRVMSRSQAKKEVRGDELMKELEKRGIEIRAGSLPGLAEEAPSAYKDVDMVVETVSKAGIAKKVARLKPVAVIKG
ncbi:MAG: RNA-splicing ligase RtcB [Chloroflexi bacterium]|nr:MAG: RNA-splicing ligase RtcB [Chloroflexota bacterium]